MSEFGFTPVDPDNLDGTEIFLGFKNEKSDEWNEVDGDRAMPPSSPAGDKNYIAWKINDNDNGQKYLFVSNTPNERTFELIVKDITNRDIIIEFDLEKLKKAFSTFEIESSDGTNFDLLTTQPITLSSTLEYTVKVKPLVVDDNDGLPKSLEVGKKSTPTLAKITKDDDINLIVGTEAGILEVYKLDDDNNWTSVDENPFENITTGIAHAAPVFTHFYNNEFLDLVVGNRAGVIKLYKNKNNSTNPYQWETKPELLQEMKNDISDISVKIDVGNNAKPAFVDVNNNGRQDLIVGNGEGVIKVYLRGNGDTFTEATEAENPFSGFDIGKNSTPAVGDLDNDGDIDLVIGSRSGKFQVYRNETWTTDIANELSELDIDWAAPSSILYDINKDGYLDIVIGSIDGTITSYSGRLLGFSPIAPVITLKGDAGDAEVTHEINTPYTDAGATAVNHLNEDISINIVIDNNVEIETRGSYSITYNVSDNNGTPAVEVTRTVTVVDTISPVITLNGDAEIEHETKTPYTDEGATATDIVDGNLDVTTTNTVDINIPGTYKVTYTATDTAGNTATKTRTVIVVDTISPVITLNGDATLILEAHPTNDYTDDGATAFDTLDGVINVEISGDNIVDLSKVGTYTITYTATDAAGNTATATRTVKVQDRTAPVITLNGDAEITKNKGVYTDPGATATDNLDGNISDSIVITSPLMDEIGRYEIRYNVSDAEGNAAEEIRIINVIEFPSKTLEVFINEFHYDNEGADENEIIEIANPTETDLNGYRILLYNGSNGTVYSDYTISESTTKSHVIIKDTIQNGAPDGIALVAPDDTPLQFISYGGEFVAKKGLLKDYTSIDIGVSENGTTPLNHSIQLIGWGNCYNDFKWAGPRKNNFGFVNTYQYFKDRPIIPSNTLDVFINEFHYDNEGADINEKIEIANPTKKKLEGYKIFLYNGANGSLYSNDYITLPNTTDKFHVITTETLQNGKPDGIALVGPDNIPLHFISYEGEFIAQDGPLVGFTSENINVSENSNTPENYSLQLKGIGNYYTDFSWEGPIEYTFGKINRNLIFPEERPIIPYHPKKDLMLIIDLDEINKCVKIDKEKSINWFTFDETLLDFAELARNNKLKVRSAMSVNNLLSKLNTKRKAIWKALNDEDDDTKGDWTETLLVGDKNLRLVTCEDIENAIAMNGININAGNFNNFNVSLKSGGSNNDTLNKQIQYLILNENRNIKNGKKLFYDNDIFASTNIHSIEIKLKEIITPKLRRILHIENDLIILAQNNSTNDTYEPQSINNDDTRSRFFIYCRESLGNRIPL